MNELINRISDLEKETFLNLGSSKSFNTLRAYKSDFVDFENFCSQFKFKSRKKNIEKKHPDSISGSLWISISKNDNW